VAAQERHQGRPAAGPHPLGQAEPARGGLKGTRVGREPTARVPRFQPLNPVAPRCAWPRDSEWRGKADRRPALPGSWVAATDQSPRIGTMNQRLKTQRLGADKDGLGNLCPPQSLGPYQAVHGEPLRPEGRALGP
jgi:hypothetical protein